MEREMFIRVNDPQTFALAVFGLQESSWGFRFPNGIPITYDAARKWYRGNSKMLLHIFYNSITGKHEMQITTATIQKSYPQYRGKKLNIVDYADTTYQDYVDVFGEAA